MVLSGDGTVRADTACQLFAQGGAPLIVCSGGVDNPPHSLTARDLKTKLIEKGVAPGRILLENESTNTREQANNVVDMAVENEWKRLLIVASPYHVYRAFLTFLKALQEKSLTDVHLVPVAASQAKWWDTPEGTGWTRMDLLEGEFSKIDAYRKKGHVASYADGLAYLERWETMGEAA